MKNYQFCFIVAILIFIASQQINNEGFKTFMVVSAVAFFILSIVTLKEK